MRECITPSPKDSSSANVQEVRREGSFRDHRRRLRSGYHDDVLGGSAGKVPRDYDDRQRERERERAGAEQIHPYLDNFITAADDYEEHLEGIRIQFKALR